MTGNHVTGVLHPLAALLTPVTHHKGEEVPKVELPRGNQVGDKRCGQVMKCNSSSSEIAHGFLICKLQHFRLPAQGQWEIEDLAQSMCVLLHPAHTKEARNLFHSYAHMYICHQQDICPLPLNNFAIIPAMWKMSQNHN